MLLTVLWCWTSGAFAQAMRIVDINAIPENEFVFGLYEIESGKMHLGVPNRMAHLRGFHFEFLMQITGIKSENEMIDRKRQGKHAGFGFIREGSTIYLHPLSSLKAAGKIDEIMTVNPLLPKPNFVWPAMLPKDLAIRIFDQLALESKLSLKIDPDVLTSSRFPFNEDKNGSKDALFAKALAARVKLASTWFDSVVRNSNQKLATLQLSACAK
jgi:hypothetical protein